MRRLIGFFLIVMISCLMAACFSPVGAIDGPRRGISGDDALWAVPARIIYDFDLTNGDFDRSTDLQIFASNRGAIRVVPVHEAQINIIENPNNIDHSRYPLREDGKYLFRRAGRKLVEIVYNNMVTRYSIEVRGAPIGGGDDFTNIIWF
jgi:hypothetical protein